MYRRSSDRSEEAIAGLVGLALIVAAIVIAVIVKQGSTVSITEYSLPYMYGTMFPQVTS